MACSGFLWCMCATLPSCVGKGLHGGSHVSGKRMCSSTRSIRVSLSLTCRYFIFLYTTWSRMICFHPHASKVIINRFFFGVETEYRLTQLLLRSEEEMRVNQSSQAPHEGVAPKPNKNTGKMMVQGKFFYSTFHLLLLFGCPPITNKHKWTLSSSAVRRVETVLDAPTGLKPSLKKFEKSRGYFSNISTRISSGWRALRKIHVRVPANGSSLSRQRLGYVHASTHYLKQVSGLLKVGVTSLRNSSTSYDVVQGMWKLYHPYCPSSLLFCFFICENFYK